MPLNRLLNYGIVVNYISCYDARILLFLGMYNPKCLMLSHVCPPMEGHTKGTTPYIDIIGWIMHAFMRPAEFLYWFFSFDTAFYNSSNL